MGPPAFDWLVSEAPYPFSAWPACNKQQTRRLRARVLVCSPLPLYVATCYDIGVLARCNALHPRLLARVTGRMAIVLLRTVRAYARASIACTHAQHNYKGCTNQQARTITHGRSIILIKGQPYPFVTMQVLRGSSRYSLYLF